MSNRPNTVQPSKTVQRIIQLKKEGLGFRRIAKKLKEEYLATISKSTVATLYNTHIATMKDRIEEQIKESPTLEQDRKELVTLESTIVKLQAEDEIVQRMKSLWLKKASMTKGIKEILTDPKQLFQFTEAVLGDTEEWKAFKEYCSTHNLDLSSTLLEAAESFETYQNEVAMGTSPQLDFYVAFNLKSFVYRKIKREKLNIPSASESVLAELGFTIPIICPKCGSRLTETENRQIKCMNPKCVLNQFY